MKYYLPYSRNVVTFSHLGPCICMQSYDTLMCSQIKYINWIYVAIYIYIYIYISSNLTHLEIHLIYSKLFQNNQFNMHLV